jgi:phosphoribosyl-ATP pyrophosphohydrolase
MNINWSTILVYLLLTLGAIWGFTKLFINNLIDNRFKNKLESLKNELQLIIENNKFDLQRKMADFNLYTTKRHEAYMNIYDLYLNADGQIRGQMGMKTSPDYNEFGLADIEKRLRSFNLLENKIEEYLEKWRAYTGTQRHELFSEIGDYLYMVEIQKANLKLVEANNYFLLRRLYLSDEVQDIIFELKKLLFDYILGVEFLMKHKTPFKECSMLEAKIEISLNKLLLQMRNELKVGYYELKEIT